MEFFLRLLQRSVSVSISDRNFENAQEHAHIDHQDLNRQIIDNTVGLRERNRRGGRQKKRWEDNFKECTG